ncbi:hypothetical protein AC579_1249 [Pseudocercospora musae]|uniref:Uncharacterized protein n=1 Tax=Pseudocercospora musae TaxID=113226 RepID=A0A139H513_9PEZI|nr:hypothetical protein AC579_1249 [Pseudocercospora musae]
MCIAAAWLSERQIAPSESVVLDPFLPSCITTITTAFPSKQTNLFTISKPKKAIANLIMGNPGSRGYSIHDAEREQHLKGNLHIIGRLPAQLVAQRQKNTLETRQQQVLPEQHNQAMHHQMHGDIFQ